MVGNREVAGELEGYSGGNAALVTALSQHPVPNSSPHFLSSYISGFCLSLLLFIQGCAYSWCLTFYSCYVLGLFLCLSTPPADAGFVCHALSHTFTPVCMHVFVCIYMPQSKYSWGNWAQLNTFTSVISESSLISLHPNFLRCKIETVRGSAALGCQG